MSKTPEAASQTPSAEATFPHLWLNGASGAGEFFAVPWRSLSEAALESQKVLSEAVTGQLNALQSAQERLNHGYMDVLACRKVQELPAAWASISVSCLDIAADQARAASGVADRLRGCYANLVQPKA